MVDDQLKRKRHAEEVQSERENLKIDAHMALANKGYAIRSLNKQSAVWTVAQTKTMATRYRQSSITNNETTTSYQIPWHHDAWRCCSTSCNCCNGATSSAPFGCSHYITRRYDGRTTSLRMMQQLLQKNTRRETRQAYHQSKNDATTTNEKTCKRYNIF